MAGGVEGVREMYNSSKAYKKRMGRNLTAEEYRLIHELVYDIAMEDIQEKKRKKEEKEKMNRMAWEALIYSWEYGNKYMEEEITALMAAKAPLGKRNFRRRFKEFFQNPWAFAIGIFLVVLILQEGYWAFLGR